MPLRVGCRTVIGPGPSSPLDELSDPRVRKGCDSRAALRGSGTGSAVSTLSCDGGRSTDASLHPEAVDLGVHHRRLAKADSRVGKSAGDPTSTRCRCRCELCRWDEGAQCNSMLGLTLPVLCIVGPEVQGAEEWWGWATK